MWNFAFGQGMQKDYDRLLLLGQIADINRNNYSELYRNAMFTYFDIPYIAVETLANENGMIDLHVDPRIPNLRGKARELYTYQVSESDLILRYA